MVKGWVSLLALAVVWIFGTLPWIMINDIMCSNEGSSACPDRRQFWRKTEIILAADIVMIVAATFSIKKIMELDRANQPNS